MLSVRIERRGGRRREEFSNLAIVVGYTENALPRRLLSEFSRRSTLVARWIAPASGSGRYYERSRGEKERLVAEKNEEEGRPPLLALGRHSKTKSPRCWFTGGQYVNQWLAVVTMSRPRRPATRLRVLKPSPPPLNRLFFSRSSPRAEDHFP